MIQLGIRRRSPTKKFDPNSQCCEKPDSTQKPPTSCDSDFATLLITPRLLVNTAPLPPKTRPTDLNVCTRSTELWTVKLMQDMCDVSDDSTFSASLIKFTHDERWILFMCDDMMSSCDAGLPDLTTGDVTACDNQQVMTQRDSGQCLSSAERPQQRPRVLWRSVTQTFTTCLLSHSCSGESNCLRR